MQSNNINLAGTYIEIHKQRSVLTGFVRQVPAPRFSFQRRKLPFRMLSNQSTSTTCQTRSFYRKSRKPVHAHPALASSFSPANRPGPYQRHSRVRLPAVVASGTVSHSPSLTEPSGKQPPASRKGKFLVQRPTESNASGSCKSRRRNNKLEKGYLPSPIFSIRAFVSGLWPRNFTYSFIGCR